MVVAQSPISQIQRRRKPLQHRNSSPTPFNSKPKPKPNAVDRIEINSSSNKENIAPIYSTPLKKEAESFDASLAEELTAIREKLDRLRLDKENTDFMLTQRQINLDFQMQELLQRGVLQKHLEIEVDRLYRLKEIKLSCLSISSPLRSLREKEKEKKIKQDQMKDENRDERKQESGLQSSDSEVKMK